MSKVTFKAELSAKINNNKRYPVKLKITYNRIPTLYSTPYYANPSEVTSGKKPQLKQGTVFYRLVEKYIESFEAAALWIDPTQFNGKTTNEVYKMILEKRNEIASDPQEFKLDFPNYARRIKQTKSTATAHNYEYAIRSLCSFMGKEHFDISELTSAKIKGYEQMLIEQKKKPKTIQNYLSIISHIHRHAQEEYNEIELDRIPIKDSFHYFRPQKLISVRKNQAVSRETIQYLIDIRQQYGKDSAVRKAIDLFLLIFALQGINVADMLIIKAPKNGILVFNRKKTSQSRPDQAHTEIKIHDCIRPLYEEHKDPSGKLAFNYGINCKYISFHMKINYWMKQLREVLSNKKAPSQCREDAKFIHFYSARHSYATISRQMGIDKGLVNDGLSHIDPDMNITDIYITKSWEPIWEANKKMLSSFDWSRL